MQYWQNSQKRDQKGKKLNSLTKQRGLRGYSNQIILYLLT